MIPAPQKKAVNINAQAGLIKIKTVLITTHNKAFIEMSISILKLLG